MLFDRILDLCYLITCLVVGAVALFVVYEVFVRYALNDPTVWVIQGSEYGLVYMTFVAAGPVLRDGGHTKMTIILEKLGPAKARYLDVFTNVIGLGTAAIFSWQTTSRLVESIQRGAAYKEGFDIWQWCIWWVMPFAFITMSIQFIRLVAEQVYNIKHGRLPGAKSESHGIA